MTAAWLVGGALVACGGSNTSGSDTVTVQGDITIAWVKRKATLGLNPTNGAPSLPGGALLVKEKSSPSAPEHDLTQQFTGGEG